MNSLPNSWQNAIQRAGQSDFLREALARRSIMVSSR